MSGTGRRLRLAAATCVAALGVLSSALPAVADGPVTLPFGLIPWPNSNGQAAPYFKLNLAAGQSTTALALISNPAKVTQKLLISRSTGVTASNGGSTFNRAFQPCSGAGCWVTGIPASVTLPAGYGEKLAFTVSVPPGTRPGQYLAGLTAESAAKSKPVKLGGNGKATAQAIITDQVTVGVAVTVGSLSGLTTRLTIPSVSAVAIGSLVRLNVEVANTGQTFAKGPGKASCVMSGERHTYPFYALTVLPHDQAQIAANLSGLADKAMTMPCTVTINYPGGPAATWSGTVTVPAAADSRVVRSGPGAYSVLPSGGIPAWATALIVIGVLLLAAVVVLLVRLQRRGNT